jgi:hypothetical protein
MFTELHTHTHTYTDTCYRTWQPMKGLHMLVCSGPKLRDKYTVNCDTSHVTATLNALDYAQIAVEFKVGVITNKKYF